MHRVSAQSLSIEAPEFNPYRKSQPSHSPRPSSSPRHSSQPTSSPRHPPQPTSSPRHSSQPTSSPRHPPQPSTSPRHPPQSSPQPSSSSTQSTTSSSQPTAQPSSSSEPLSPVKKFLDELVETEWVKNLNLDTQELINLSLDNILMTLCGEACGESINSEVENLIESYLDYIIKPTAIYPNMVFIPKIFARYCQLIRKNSEMITSILEYENLYWIVMYCIQNGIYASWSSLRKLILDLNVEIQLELYIEMINPPDFDNFQLSLKIIEEASQLGFKDHRFEAAIVRFQRIIRKQPVEPRVKLLNIDQIILHHDVDGAHLNLLRYNKSLYPHIMTKMTSSIFNIRWDNRSWVESYRILNDDISNRYDEVRRHFIDVLNKMCFQNIDNCIKVNSLISQIQFLFPNFNEYHPIQFLRQNYSMIIKLRFNMHRFKTENNITEFPRNFALVPYRFMKMILEILPWLTSNWGSRVIEVFKRIQLNRINDATLRFWFFHISVCQPENLLTLYPEFKVKEEKFRIFFSGPITYPIELGYPSVPENYILHFKNNLPYFAIDTGSERSLDDDSQNVSNSNRRTLINRIMDRRKIRLMVQAHLRNMQKIYQRNEQPKEHELYYNEIIVEPVKIHS